MQPQDALHQRTKPHAGPGCLELSCPCAGSALPIFLSTYLSTHLPIYLSTGLPIYRSTYVSIELFIDLSIHRYVHHNYNTPHTHTHVYIYIIYIYTYIHMSVYIYMSVRVYIYIYFFSLFICDMKWQCASTQYSTSPTLLQRRLSENLGSSRLIRTAGCNISCHENVHHVHTRSYPLFQLKHVAVLADANTSINLRNLAYCRTTTCCFLRGPCHVHQSLTTISPPRRPARRVRSPHQVVPHVSTSLQNLII